MDFTGVASVIGITVICYLVGVIARATAIDNKWIPVIVGVSGAVLGVAGMYVIADFPAADVINALAVGIRACGYRGQSDHENSAEVERIGDPLISRTQG